MLYRVLFIIYLFFSLALSITSEGVVLANEDSSTDCLDGSNFQNTESIIQKQSEEIITLINPLTGNPETDLEIAKSYLGVISGINTNQIDLCIDPNVPEVVFDTRTAKQLAERMVEIADNQKLQPLLRSNAYLAQSGIAGLIARQEKSPSWGKTAFYALKNSLATDSSNKTAIISHAKAVSAIMHKFVILRFFATRYIGVDLDKEADEAISNLKRVEGPQCILKALAN